MEKSYTLRIAIAGKREHPKLEALKTDGRLEKILKILSGLQSETQSVKIQFLTGLADGGDQVVTEKIADYFSIDNKVADPLQSIDAILPFSVQDYRNHPLYPIKEKDRFNTLLGKCSRTVFVNDVDTSDKICKEDYPHLREAADRGYEAQALLMLRRCDILLAVANPKDAVKPGGTLHTVNKARAYHIPVIFVSLPDDQTADGIDIDINIGSDIEIDVNIHNKNTNDSNGNGIYVLDDDETFIDTVELTILKHKDKDESIALQSLFDKVLSLQTPVYPKEGKVDYEEILDAKSGENYFPKKIWGRLRACFWTSVDTTLKAKILREQQKNSPGKNEKIRRTLWGNFWHSVGNELFASTGNINTGSENEKTEIGKMRAKADNANSFYANQYRGGYMLNIFLAILAVMIAVTSLLALYFGVSTEICGKELLEYLGFASILILLATLKLSTLWAIDRNSKLGQQRDWNKKSIETRYLAERLRIFEYLYFNGILRGIKPSLGKHQNPAFQSAPPEAIYRKKEGHISFKMELFDENGHYVMKPIDNLEKMNNELISEQIAYHTSTSQKMEILEHFLEHGGKRLNKITIGLVILDIIILIFSIKVPEDCIGDCYLFLTWAHHVGTPVFICITALFPAVVAAFNAIRFQSEARKLKERYATMKELLTTKYEKIDYLLHKARNTDLKGSEILETYPLIAEVEQIMLDEVSDWSILYSKEFVET